MSNIINHINLQFSEFEKQFKIADAMGDVESLVETGKKLDEFIKTARMLLSESRKNNTEFEIKSASLQNQFANRMITWTSHLSKPPFDAPFEKSSVSKSQPSKKQAESVPETKKISASTPTIRDTTPIDPRTITATMTEFPAIGLWNRNSNCWANSLLQMIINSATISQKILNQENSKLGCLAQLITQYYKEQIIGLKTSSVRSEDFRKLASTLNKEFSSFRHEDPYDALVDIFKAIGFEYQILQSYTQNHYKNGKLISSDKPSLASFEQPIIEIDLYESKNVKFTDSFAQFLEYYNEQGSLFQLKFVETPSDLFVRAKTYTDTHEKLDANIDVPFTFSLDAKYTISNQEEEYDFVGCIAHIGSFHEVGHYIAIEKRGNTLFYIDDESTREISETEAKKWLSKGYIFHFIKRQRQTVIPAFPKMPDSRPLLASASIIEPATAVQIKPIAFPSKSQALVVKKIETPSEDWTRGPAFWVVWTTVMVVKKVLTILSYPFTKVASLLSNYDVKKQS